MNVDGITFRSLKLDGERSIAADLPDGACCGVYAYEFDDGTWYVGKATDVRRRHVDHLHEWRHDEPPKRAVRILFAELPANDPGLLDRAETRAIHAFVDAGYDLTNVMKTSSPRGARAVRVSIDGTFGVEVPWSRAERESAKVDRAKARDLSALKTRDARKRLDWMMGHDGADELVRLLGKLAAEALPSPAATAGVLWAATARTRGNGLERLCCLSVGNVEVLTAFPGKHRISGFVNMKAKERDVDGSLREARFPAALKRAGFRAGLAGYRAADGVLRVDFWSLDELSRILERDDVLDHVYSLAAELVRKGSCMHAGRGNGQLMERVLEEAGRR